MQPFHDQCYLPLFTSDLSPQGGLGFSIKLVLLLPLNVEYDS